MADAKFKKDISSIVTEDASGFRSREPFSSAPRITRSTPTTPQKTNFYPSIPSYNDVSYNQTPVNPDYDDRSDHIKETILTLQGRCELCFGMRNRCAECKSKWNEERKRKKKEIKMKNKIENQNENIENIEMGPLSRSKSMERLNLVSEVITNKAIVACGMYKRYVIVTIMSFIIFLALYGLSVLFPVFNLSHHSSDNATHVNTIGRIQHIINTLLPKESQFHEISLRKPLSMKPIPFETKIDINLTFACSYFIADCEGMVMPCVLGSRNLEYSLHGAWNLNTTSPRNGSSDDCLTYEEFVSVFPTYKHFIDASPRSNFTCCHLQYHEYIKHGCHEGYTYSEWLYAIGSCLMNYSVNVHYLEICRFDSSQNCNHPEQVLSVVPEVTTGCLPNYPTCTSNPVGCSFKSCFNGRMSYHGRRFMNIKDVMPIGYGELNVRGTLIK